MHNRSELQHWVALRPRPLRSWPPTNTLLPHIYYPTEFGCSRWIFDRSLLKVIGTDADRSAIFDFLLKFRSNNWPISYHFRDKRRFQSKIANFPTPVYLTPKLKGFPLELGTGGWHKKTSMIGLPGRERNLTTYSAIWIQYRKWQTDGRMDTEQQQRLCLRISSRSKNHMPQNVENWDKSGLMGLKLWMSFKLHDLYCNDFRPDDNELVLLLRWLSVFSACLTIFLVVE